MGSPASLVDWSPVAGSFEKCFSQPPRAERENDLNKDMQPRDQLGDLWGALCYTLSRSVVRCPQLTRPCLAHLVVLYLYTAASIAFRSRPVAELIDATVRPN